MLRILLFVVLLTTVGFFIQQTSQINGEIVAHFYGYEIKTSTQFVFILCFVLGLLAFFLGQIWAFLVQAPQTFEKWRYTKRYEQGFDYFVEALEYLKSDEVKSAQKVGKRAQKLLPDERLKNILSAEIEVKKQQPLKAIPYFESLSKQKSSNFMGLMGLVEQYTKLKDWVNVEKYAEQALIHNVKNKTILDALFKAYIFLDKHEKTLKMIPGLQKYGSFTSEFLDDVESCIYLEKGYQEQNLKDRYRLFSKAYKVNEYNIYALFEMVDQQEKVSKKLRLLNNAFHKAPHPDIYEKWLKTIKNEPNKYYKRRLKALLKGYTKSFAGLYIQAKEHYRLGDYTQSLEFLEKASNLVFNEDVLKQKLLCLNMLEKHEEVKTLVEDHKPYDFYAFKGQDFINFYNKWQSKAIFDKTSNQSQATTRLLTHG